MKQQQQSKVGYENIPAPDAGSHTKSMSKVSIDSKKNAQESTYANITVDQLTDRIGKVSIQSGTGQPRPIERGKNVPIQKEPRASPRLKESKDVKPEHAAINCRAPVGAQTSEQYENQYANWAPQNVGPPHYMNQQLSGQKRNADGTEHIYYNIDAGANKTMRPQPQYYNDVDRQRSGGGFKYSSTRTPMEHEDPSAIYYNDQVVQQHQIDNYKYLNVSQNPGSFAGPTSKIPITTPRATHAEAVLPHLDLQDTVSILREASVSSMRKDAYINISATAGPIHQQHGGPPMYQDHGSQFRTSATRDIYGNSNVRYAGPMNNGSRQPVFHESSVLQQQPRSSQSHSPTYSQSQSPMSQHGYCHSQSPQSQHGLPSSPQSYQGCPSPQSQQGYPSSPLHSQGYASSPHSQQGHALSPHNQSYVMSPQSQPIYTQQAGYSPYYHGMQTHPSPSGSQPQNVPSPLSSSGLSPSEETTLYPAADSSKPSYSHDSQLENISSLTDQLRDISQGVDLDIFQSIHTPYTTNGGGQMTGNGYPATTAPAYATSTAQSYPTTTVQSYQNVAAPSYPTVAAPSYTGYRVNAAPSQFDLNPYTENTLDDVQPRPLCQFAQSHAQVKPNMGGVTQVATSVSSGVLMASTNAVPNNKIAIAKLPAKQTKTVSNVIPAGQPIILVVQATAAPLPKKVQNILPKPSTSADVVKEPKTKGKGGKGQKTNKGPNAKPGGRPDPKTETINARAMIAVSTDDQLLRRERGETVLHTAIIMKNHPVTVAILQATRNRPALVPLIEMMNSKGQTPLFMSVITAQAWLTEVLVNKMNANCDTLCKYEVSEGHLEDELTALHYASKHGNRCIKELQAILASGSANIDLPSRKGMTALHLALWNHGHVDSKTKLPIDSKNVVKCLLDAGAKCSIEDTKSGKTALHFAVENGSLDLTRLLLESSGQPSTLIGVHNYERRTALHSAVSLRTISEDNKIDLVQYLISKGASKNSKDKDRHTPRELVNPTETRLLALFTDYASPSSAYSTSDEDSYGVVHSP